MNVLYGSNSTNAVNDGSLDGVNFSLMSHGDRGVTSAYSAVHAEYVLALGRCNENRVSVTIVLELLPSLVLLKDIFDMLRKKFSEMTNRFANECL